MEHVTFRVLLVEDDDDHARLFERRVRAAGIGEVLLERATNLGQARERVGDTSLHVVFLDLGLPESDGIATLETILSCAPAAPVVVLTANDDLELGLHAVRMGALDCFYKGDLKPGTLARSILHATERSQRS